ncbi:uncharacterized protein LOC143369858 [Andrena cerasifolii]|uniref:uncharacterized protein LOC143369858 n=1 Tax=Andrena cerasifolii TaxID=2819439 RepID=UPI00403826C6
MCRQVDRARGNVQYIGEQVARGMKEMKGDVGEELRVTDRLTAQSSKLAGVLKRFATLEENVLELVRMDRNRENARIETPADVNEEIRRIVAASERKTNGQRGQGGQHRAKLRERVENEVEVVAEAGAGGVAVADADARRSAGRDSVYRNPLSKFSACSPREVGFVARKPIDDRPRTPTTPEVRLLGERIR